MHFRWIALCLLATPAAFAGVFNTPQFVLEDRFAIGIEPELVFSDPAGAGVNAHYTHGVSDLLNAGAVVGYGGGKRKFRVGGKAVFDFFPDTEDQPGIGIAAQGLFVDLKQGSQLELSLIPYIHNLFVSDENTFDPFVAVPFGIAIGSGDIMGQATVVVGSNFKQSEHFGFVLELGVEVSNTDTYLSGGVIYSY